MVETAEFQKQVKAVWNDAEREAFINRIAANPGAGDVIPGADGARKVRWGRAGKGKRGGTSSGVENMKALKKMDVNKIARAIETDAGHALQGLRESLAEAKAGDFLRVHTPEQIVARRRGRPAGSRPEVTKEAVKLRLDADVMAALRASGDGWQTASMRLCGRR